jgi:hypothetical protein
MKHRFLVSCIAMGGVFASTSAFADDGIGLDLGLRLGYGIPMGSSAKDVKMSDHVDGQIPIWIDAGYRFTPNIMAGAYFSYGFMGLKDCPSGADCSAHDMRLGLQGQYRIMPGEFVDPWVGVGIGLEWLGSSVSGGGQTVSTTASGTEFLDLQGGADFKVADMLTVGPFLSLSLAQYNGLSTSCPAGLQCADGDIHDKALHEWLILGVRGVFGI